MVTDGYQAYRGNHFLLYLNVESLCFTPKTSIILYVNYIPVLFLFFLKCISWTSLVAQWRRICLPVQETWVQSWFRKLPHASEQLSLCTTATELTLRSPHAQSPCSATREATQREVCAPQPERSPRSPNQRKPACSNEDPVQP